MGSSFFVPGVPVAQPRPKVIRMGDGVRAVSNHGPVKQWREIVAMVAATACGAAPIGLPMGVRLEFVLPVPKTYLKKDGTLRKGRSPLPVGKPDLDNLSKAVLDAMNQILFTDDSLVVSLHATKAWALPPREPGVHVHHYLYPNTPR